MPPIPDSLRQEDEDDEEDETISLQPRQQQQQQQPDCDVVDKCERWCRERIPLVADESKASATPEEDCLASLPPAAAAAVTAEDVAASPAATAPDSPTSATLAVADVTLATTTLTPPLAPPSPPESSCKWLQCALDVGSCDKLVEHIRLAHVDSQAAKGEPTFVCLWAGCKVYNRPSCSLSWLERHVVSHGGSKPFRCIVDGCRGRFTSQRALERHVNSHFNGSQASASAANSACSSSALNSQRLGRKDDTPSKLLKKRKLRYRRRAWPAKTGDFFDAGMMEHVREGLLESAAAAAANAACTDATATTTQSPSNITFTSTVIGRRVEESGKVRLLLHWTPEDVLPDQWILESQLSANLRNSIPLWLLPPHAMYKLDPTLQAFTPPKRRRK